LALGNHEGLQAQSGHYATLYNTYFRHQSLNYRPDWMDEAGMARLQITLDGQEQK
jgi:hypothetical protein